jgi:DNA-binding PadR family transcriptional regulator
MRTERTGCDRGPHGLPARLAARVFAGGGSRGRSRGGGRPWWVEASGERPPRAERGVVRYLVLDAIEKEARHGYEIIQHIEQRAGSAYRPSPGIIYPTLQMLEDLGHAEIAGGGGRKAYAITESGRADLAANRAAVDDFYAGFGGASSKAGTADFRELVRIVGRLMRALQTATRGGPLEPSTKERIRDALTEALAKIEEAVHGARR